MIRTKCRIMEGHSEEDIVMGKMKSGGAQGKDGMADSVSLRVTGIQGREDECRHLHNTWALHLPEASPPPLAWNVSSIPHPA